MHPSSFLFTVMYPAYAKWVQSHRDLPIKLNQWCNVVVSVHSTNDNCHIHHHRWGQFQKKNLNGRAQTYLKWKTPNHVVFPLSFAWQNLLG